MRISRQLVCDCVGIFARRDNTVVTKKGKYINGKNLVLVIVAAVIRGRGLMCSIPVAGARKLASRLSRKQRRQAGRRSGLMPRTGAVDAVHGCGVRNSTAAADAVSRRRKAAAEGCRR